MSQPKLNKRQRQERWTQAVELAKKGQYGKVRFVLQDMHDEPRVRKLLQKIEGRDDKDNQSVTAYFNVVLVVIVVVGIAILAIVWNFAGNITEQTTSRADTLLQYEERGLTGGRELFEDLLVMCYDGTSNDNPACVDWAADALTNHRQLLPACVFLFEDGSLDYGALTEAEVAACFMDQGAPPFPAG